MDSIEDRDEASGDHNREHQLLDVVADNSNDVVQLQKIHRGGIVEKCSELQLSSIYWVHHIL